MTDKPTDAMIEEIAGQFWLRYGEIGAPWESVVIAIAEALGCYTAARTPITSPAEGDAVGNLFRFVGSFADCSDTYEICQSLRSGKLLLGDLRALLAALAAKLNSDTGGLKAENSWLRDILQGALDKLDAMTLRQRYSDTDDLREYVATTRASLAGPAPEVTAKPNLVEALNDAVATVAAVRATASTGLAGEWAESADHFYRVCGDTLKRCRAALAERGERRNPRVVSRESLLPPDIDHDMLDYN